MRLRTPSIQPKQRASSTDSDQVMLGRPESTLWNPTISSGVVAALVSSQRRKLLGFAKNFGFGMGFDRCGMVATILCSKTTAGVKGEREMATMRPQYQVSDVARSMTWYRDALDLSGIPYPSKVNRPGFSGDPIV